MKDYFFLHLKGFLYLNLDINNKIKVLFKYYLILKFFYTIYNMNYLLSYFHTLNIIIHILNLLGYYIYNNFPFYILLLYQALHYYL